MLDDEIAVLDQLQPRDQDAAEQAVKKNGFPHVEKIAANHLTPLGLSA